MSNRRVVVKAVGGYEQLQVEECPSAPEPLDGEVRVKVMACGLNFYDTYVRHGLSPYSQPPCTLGLECSGEVEAVGGNVEAIKVGDHVAVHMEKGGACAAEVTVDAASVLLLPQDLDYVTGAAFTVNYITSYFATMHLGGLKEGGAVLIHGAAGGVGWAATQLARKVPGVTVFGTASLAKHPDIMANGVQFPIHYDQNYEQEVLRVRPQGVSLVLDSLGGYDFAASQRLLQPLGKVVLLGARGMVGGEHRSLWRILTNWWNTKNVSPYSLVMNNYAVAGLNMNSLKEKDPATFNEGWKKILNMISAKELEPRIDSIWKFEDIVAASKRITERQNIGKVIVCP